MFLISKCKNKKALVIYQLITLHVVLKKVYESLSLGHAQIQSGHHVFVTELRRLACRTAYSRKTPTQLVGLKVKHTIKPYPCRLHSDPTISILSNVLLLTLNIFIPISQNSYFF
jgi:hypothetical protein